MERIYKSIGDQDGRSGRGTWLGLAAGALLLAAQPGQATRLDRPSPPPGTAPADVYGLPLNFEPGAASTGRPAEYLAHGAGYTIRLADRGAELSLGQDVAAAGTVPAKESASTVRLVVLDARREIAPSAENPLPGRVNYLIGNDPSKWRTDVATFGRVRYAGVYPGVDLVYYGTQGRLEYDFVVAPGASARAIGLSFDGAQQTRLDARGNLEVQAGGREIVFLRPVAYQMAAGRRIPVEASYALDGGNALHFNVGRYDHRKTLVIDPVLRYFSYLGGSNSDVIGSVGPTGGAAGVGNLAVGSQGAAVDASGNLYVAGYTFSSNFPTKSPAQANAPTANPVAFVTKIAPDAKTLVYSTYLGGSTDDYAYGIAVDSGGNAFVVGMAGSNDFPVTNGAYQTLCDPSWSSGSAMSACARSANGPSAAFVSKLSPTGTLLASSFLGGSGLSTYAWAVAVDTAGRPYVAGTSAPGQNVPAGTGGFPQAIGFPTTAGAIVGAYNYCNGCNINGGLQTDAFMSVFSPTLTSLVYSTLFGDKQAYAAGISLGNTAGTAVTVDSSGNFYLAGYTQDGYLPVTAGALQTTVASCGVLYPGENKLNGACGFVAKFSPVGGANPPTLTYATYLGHMPSCCGIQYVAGIAADASGDAYVLGYANQTGFPTTAGAYQPTCGSGGACGNVAFIAELNPAGTQLLHSTYFGDLTGSADNVYQVGPIVLDSINNVYISGVGNNGLPQVNPLGAGGYTSGPGNSAPFVAKLDPTLSKLLLSTLVGDGGAGQSSVDGLALDTSGNIYLAGNVGSVTSSAATAGVFQPAAGGAGDGFVAKIVQTIATSTSLATSSASVTTGTSVTFTATVTQAAGSTVPTGTVTFSDGTTALGTGTVNGTGVAMYSTTALSVGAHNITAAYGGDTGDSGSTSTAVAVTVTPPVPTVTISAAPTTITLGQSATLTWSSTDATSCTASGAWSGAQATSGTVSVTPATAGSPSYNLTCSGAGGIGNGAVSLTVNAPPMPTVAISITPTTITLGQSATLTWSSSNATTCTASGTWSGAEATSGSLSVSPTSTGTASYALACTGTGGSANGSASLTVNAAATGGGGHGGGGSFDAWTLAGLLMLGFGRVAQQSLRRQA